MIVSLLVAASENQGIGFQGKIPWKIKSDMKRFKDLTMGHHIIMGRKTFESIGKPLPNRTNIVLTRDPDYSPGFDECVVMGSLGRALDFAKQRGETEVFIIGGEAVYSEGLKVATKLYLTEVHAQVPADAYFPCYYEKFAWLQQTCEHIPADEDNEYASTYKIFTR